MYTLSHSILNCLNHLILEMWINHWNASMDMKRMWKLIDITYINTNCRVWAMPSKPCCPDTIQRFLDQFNRFPELKHRGFSFLLDCSGRLYKSKKPSLKDIEGNIEAAVIFWNNLRKCSPFFFSKASCIASLKIVPCHPWSIDSFKGVLFSPRIGPEPVEKGHLEK